MESTLIIPTEMPVKIEDIKRALATYDSVYLASPDDRELIPPTSYTYAVSGGMPLLSFFSFPMGPVRPLGKIEGYDDAFEKVWSECNPAIRQNSINRLTPPDPKYNPATIGGLQLPPDTPNPVFTYANYTRLIQNQKFIDLISVDLDKIDLKAIKDASQLAPPCLEDGNYEGKGMVSKENLTIDENLLLSRIAHSRIGSLVKYLSYCHIKKIVPFTTDKGIASAMSELEYCFKGSIDSLAEHSAAIKRQQRLNTFQNFVLEEFIDPEKLNELSLKQILNLRSLAWGKNFKARQKFLNSLAEISSNYPSDAEFKKACSTSIQEYEKAAADYKNELGNLKLSYGWKLASTAMLGTSTGLLEKLISAPSLETLLAVGAIPLAALMNDAVRVCAVLQNAIDSKQTTGYSIYRPYRYIMTKS